MKAVYKKDLKSAFTGMIGWVLCAFVVVVVGLYFTAICLQSGYADFSLVLYNTTFIFLVVVPLLTTCSIVEERRQKTDQLLLTSRASIAGIVWGKYLALVTVYAIPLAIVGICPLVMRAYGSVSLARSHAALLAFFLMGAAAIAIGLFMSSLTENQIIAAVCTFGSLLFLYLMPSIAGLISGSAAASLAAFTVLAALLAGCGSTATGASSADSTPAATEAAGSEATAPTAEPQAEAALPDGVYTAEFETDSSMVHANEACDGKGTLTVADGKMTFHVSLASKKIVNLYLGTAEDAPSHESDWLQPTTDTVTYSDGTSDEVYGYDIPLDAVDTDFQLAILGTKGTWYDHTVSVRNAEPKTEDAAAETAAVPADGSYTCAVTLEGGSGRATVESPAALTVADGTMTAVIVWSSPNYDYMLIDGEKYLPTNTEGNSTFEIPVAALDTALAVTADTVAMSTPHEIDYTLTFDSATLTPAE